MGLETYWKKRDFAKTREPRGKIGRKKNSNPIFVVQEHHASHLHYDVRLEAEGVLKSWAVPKGPSMRAGEKRLAVETEDHPLEYARFYGEIAAGEYGAGVMSIWDQGTYEPMKPFDKAYADGRIEFVFHGKKLKGGFVLVRSSREPASKPNWFLIKRRDRFAEGVPGTSASGDSKELLLKVEGKVLKLTHLDKVLYPKTGFTKKNLLNYYRKIAPVLLPHLRGRPVTLKRYPDGVESEFFYEKRCPTFAPSWIQKIPMRGIEFCEISDLATLLWVANLATVELHPYLSRTPNLDESTLLVFDLDPGPGVGLLDCAQLAENLRTALRKLKLESFAKSSGMKGLQIYVPLNSGTSFDLTKAFARRMAEVFEKRYPDLVVARMAKELRTGKILIDWSQNDEAKTTAGVYSLRGGDAPTVSTPVSWPEIRAALKKKNAEVLRFSPDEVLKRIEKYGDLFAPLLEMRQELPTAKTWHKK